MTGIETGTGVFFVTVTVTAEYFGGTAPTDELATEPEKVPCKGELDDATMEDFPPGREVASDSCGVSGCGCPGPPAWEVMTVVYAVQVVWHSDVEAVEVVIELLV